MPEPENRAFSDKFMLRLPDGMRDRIKASAEKSNRSMNAEIIAALDEAFPPPYPQNKGEIAEAYADLVSINDDLEKAVRRWLRIRQQQHGYKG